MIAAPLRLPAPGKLNLMLHIIGRRADGYHRLQSLFQYIDWGDELQFSAHAASHIELIETQPSSPSEENLIVKAAKKLQDYSGCTQGARIHLTKNLPIGGGVGGGSSDAATTLIALNHLWQLHLSVEQLIDISLSLGVDIAFFLQGHNAFVEGIGDRFIPVALPTPWYVIVVPETPVYTAPLYAHAQLTRDTPLITMDDALNQEGHNDFEPLVRTLYPEIDTLFTQLNSWGKARLTGSGGCVFCAFTDLEQARQAQAQLAQRWRTLLCQGCHQSPLLTALNAQFSMHKKECQHDMLPS